MTFIKRVKGIIKKNPMLLYLISVRKRIRFQRLTEKYDDKEFIERLYKKDIGRNPDLSNPKYFTEKLQWLKLYYRDKRIPICSDKFEVKNYLSELGYSDMLIPTLAVYDSVRELNIDDLPEEFIIKATHGSRWNLICRDKKKIDWFHAKKTMETWLKQNLYIYGREWNYKEQTPRLIVEPLMDTKPLIDYKFMCFNGKCRAMQVNHDIKNKHYVDFYDGDWNLIKGMSCGAAAYSYGISIPKPDKFEEMKKIAETLSASFPFVRVDLYYINGKIYFGEMTFFPGSGLWHITPEEKDREFGDWLDLSNIDCLEMNSND